jgi:Flp pilus assembly protein TadG
VRAEPRRRQRGSITVEFALVFPVLVAVLFGMIDVGRFIATRTMLATAAAASARAACLSTTTSGNFTTALATAATDAAPMLSGLTAAPTCAAACSFPLTTGSVVRVRVTYTFVAVFYGSFSRSLTNDSLITC